MDAGVKAVCHIPGRRATAQMLTILGPLQTTTGCAIVLTMTLHLVYADV